MFRIFIETSRKIFAFGCYWMTQDGVGSRQNPMAAGLFLESRVRDGMARSIRAQSAQKATRRCHAIIDFLVASNRQP
jgi:hypothetical protein